MAATAQASSLSDVSPLMPTAPTRSPSGVRIRTPPGTGHDPALGERVDSVYEVGLLLRPLEDRAGAHAERQCAIGFSMRDLSPQQARSILDEGGLQAAAGIEEDDGERV